MQGHVLGGCQMTCTHTPPTSLDLRAMLKSQTHSTHMHTNHNHTYHTNHKHTNHNDMDTDTHQQHRHTPHTTPCTAHQNTSTPNTTYRIKTPPLTATNPPQGKPSPLLSSFKLSYYTMLNMLRRMEGGDRNMEFVIKNSFQQFQQERALPKVGGWVAGGAVRGGL